MRKMLNFVKKKKYFLTVIKLHATLLMKVIYLNFIAGVRVVYRLPEIVIKKNIVLFILTQ